MDHKILLVVCTIVSFLFACQVNPDQSAKQEFDDQKIIDEVTQAVWSFHKADTMRDAEAVINLIWPEIIMMVDGHNLDYDEISEGSRNFMKSISLFHTEWKNLIIKPLCTEIAISSFYFRDSIINNAGILTRSEGPNSFVWEKRSGEWRVIYGDADHYPVE